MKTAISYLVAAVLFGSLLGCDTTPKKTEPEPKIITLYSDGASAEQKQIWNKAKEQFETAHPGVIINYMYYSDSGKVFSTANYKEGIDEWIQKGKSPDIVSGNPAFFTSLAKDGYLVDLHFLAKQSATALSEYFERSLLDSFTSGTKQLGVPTVAMPMVVIYNKSVFLEAGLPEPSGDWTWEDLENVAKKLQSRSDRLKFATVFPVMYLSTLAISNGGSLFSPDGSSFKGYLNGKQSVEAIAWYAQQVRDGLFNPMLDQNTLKLLQNGEVGMVVTHYSLSSSVLPENIDKVGIIAAPSFANKPRAILGTIGGMAILQESKHPEIAWDFLRFVTMDKNEISEAFLRDFGIGISNKVTPIQEKDPYYRILLESLPLVRTDLHQINADVLNVQSQLRYGLETIVMNSSDIQHDLNNLAQFMDSELKKSIQK